MKSYFIAEGGKQKGPFSIDELKRLKIKSDTLLWNEEMENWKKAVEIDELKEIIVKIPPIPSKNGGEDYQASPDEQKKKPEAKVTLAKEIIMNFKLIVYALIIGLFALPVFYFGIFNVHKYDNFNASKVEVTNDGGGYSISGLGGLSKYFGNYTGNKYADVHCAIVSRKEDLTSKTYLFSLYIFVFSAALLILIRYLSKGIRWVKTTSER